MKWNAPPRPKQSTKTVPFRGSAGVRRGTVSYNPEWGNDRAITEALERVTWVYRCVDAIAGNAARMELVVREENPWDGPVTEIEDLYRVLNSKANPGEDSFTFRYRLSAQLLLSRTGVYVQVIRTNGGDVSALYLLPPESVTPVKDTEEIVKQWIVTSRDAVGNTKTEVLEREEVIWIKRPHPFDPYKALTPLAAAGLAIEMDWLAKLYNRNFLINDGRPGGLVVIKGDMMEDDKEELRARFSGGVARAGRVSVIASDQGADFVDTAINPRDAQYQESRQITKDEILLAFGVPESVLANASDRTFDNAEQERLVFWQETMIPHLDMIVRPMDALDGDDATFLSYNLTRVDVLQRMEMKRREYILREFDAGALDANEYREATGRDPIPGDRGKIMWIPRTKKMAAMSDGSDFPMEAEATNVPQEHPGPGRPADDTVQPEPEDEREREDERLPEMDNTETVDAGQTTAESPAIAVKSDYVDSVRASYDMWSEIAKSAVDRVTNRIVRVVTEKAGSARFRSNFYRGSDPSELTDLVFVTATWVKQLNEDLQPILKGAYSEANTKTAKLLDSEATADFDVRLNAKLIYEIREIVRDIITSTKDPRELPTALQVQLEDLVGSHKVADFCAQSVVSAYNQGIDEAIRKADAEKMWVKIEDTPGQSRLHGTVVKGGSPFHLGKKTLNAPGGSLSGAVIVPVKDGIPVV